MTATISVTASDKTVAVAVNDYTIDERGSQLDRSILVVLAPNETRQFHVWAERSVTVSETNEAAPSATKQEISAESPDAEVMSSFSYAHLPPHLQSVSRPFSEVANSVYALKPGYNRTVALQKLLEAKDAAVRASVVAQQASNHAGLPPPSDPVTFQPPEEIISTAPPGGDPAQ